VRTWLGPTAARSDCSSSSFGPIGEHAATPHIDRILPSALPPLILLIGAAAVEPLRLPIVAILVVASTTAIVLARRSAVKQTELALVYCGCLVVALGLAWGSVPRGALIDGDVPCADQMAPFALMRIVGAALVLTSVALIVRLASIRPSSIGLRWPTRGWLLLSLVAVPLVGVAAALLGPRLAEPFFGPLSAASTDLASLVPAIAFALANATMEEVAYRGALLRWLTPATGVVNALALQAFVFGLAHGVGTDFIGSPLPVMAATAVAGLLLGALALRTRSLLLPIAIHLALDIPVFYGKVCLGT
jgi:membrane protease YdiL (CAAX protease family)